MVQIFSSTQAVHAGMRPLVQALSLALVVGLANAAAAKPTNFVLILADDVGKLPSPTPLKCSPSPSPAAAPYLYVHALSWMIYYYVRL